MQTGEIFLDGVTYSFGEDGFMEGRVQIDVPVILQNPELPNGCEITSLTEVLQYLGFQVTHTEMAGYLPCGTDHLHRRRRPDLPTRRKRIYGRPGDHVRLVLL